jgi:hypothetical protein
MDRVKALALVKKHKSVRKAAKAANMVRSTFQRLLETGIQPRSQQKPKSKQPAKTTPEEKVHAKKLSEFREKYDKNYFIPKRVKAALAKLGAGWDYEVSFAKMAEVSLTDLNSVREQFIDYVVQIGRDGRRAWCGSKTVAEQMRRMV